MVEEYNSREFAGRFSKKFTLLTLSHRFSTADLDRKISFELNPRKTEELLKEKGKTKLGPILELVSEEIDKSPRVRQGEPVIASTFTVWRSEALKVFKKIAGIFSVQTQRELLLYLVQKLDFELLPKFLKTAWRNYGSNINMDAFGIHIDPTVDPELHQKLEKQIAKWIINIELINDTLDRLAKYEIVDCSKSDTFSRCRDKWKPSVRYSLMHYLVNSYTLSMATKLQQTFTPTGLRKGLAICKLPFAATFSFGVLKSLLQGTFIKTVLVYPAMGYFSVLMGGMLMTKAISLEKEKLKSMEKESEVERITQCFKTTNSNIKDLLRQVNVLILEMLKESTQGRKEKIENLVKMLLGEVQPVYSYEQVNEEEAKCPMEYLKTEEVEDEWMNITNVDVQNAKVDEEMEGEIVSLSIQKNS
eukprot:TRINITY_DN7811_c0_g1_i8.p1 TRINITY_DN7811_c0_g1~~TRINITY_DN7811_c0_g1_i8.p1  ORF type:complete len:452 (-),score=143.05 TRINITY_DN7811_c0_g1_i8:135-1385(-)